MTEEFEALRVASEDLDGELLMDFGEPRPGEYNDFDLKAFATFGGLWVGCNTHDTASKLVEYVQGTDENCKILTSRLGVDTADEVVASPFRRASHLAYKAVAQNAEGEAARLFLNRSAKKEWLSTARLCSDRADEARTWPAYAGEAVYAEHFLSGTLAQSYRVSIRIAVGPLERRLLPDNYGGSDTGCKLFLFDHWQIPFVKMFFSAYRDSAREANKLMRSLGRDAALSDEERASFEWWDEFGADQEWRTCSRCGCTVFPEAKFCPDCGTPVY